MMIICNTTSFSKEINHFQISPNMSIVATVCGQYLTRPLHVNITPVFIWGTFTFIDRIALNGNFWSKNVLLIFAWDVTIYNKKVYVVFSPQRWLKRAVLDQLTGDRRGVSRARYVDVDVGCLHFNGTSTALLRHFNSKKKCIVASICIGQEIQSLQYAGLQQLQQFCDTKIRVTCATKQSRICYTNTKKVTALYHF